MKSRRATDSDVTFQNFSELHDVVAAGGLRGYGSPVTSLKDSIDQHYDRNARNGHWSHDVTDSADHDVRLHHSRSEEQHSFDASAKMDARDVRRHLSAPADTRADGLSLHASSSGSMMTTSSGDSEVGDGYSNNNAMTGAGALQRITDDTPPVPLR